MDKQPVSFKLFFLTVGFSSLILLFLLTKESLNKNSKIVFCDVGQGDAVYIRTKEKQDILIDAGPDRKVLTCLGKYMPFYDRTIELAFLSHPQKDHYGGYLSIFNRYKIETFILLPLDSNSQSFSQFKEKLINKKIAFKYLYAESVIWLSGKDRKIGNSKISLIWPKQKFLMERAEKEIADIKSAGNKVLGLLTTQNNLNDFSQMLIFSENNFNLLLSSDISAKILKENIIAMPNKIDIFKVPHHGSKNGLTFDFLKLANPTLSVISVGKNNPHGHPSQEVLEIFKALNKKYLRTDEKGDIMIEVGNGSWQIKN